MITYMLKPWMSCVVLEHVHYYKLGNHCQNITIRYDGANSYYASLSGRKLKNWKMMKEPIYPTVKTPITADSNH
jgi:hypothetical protein